MGRVEVDDTFLAMSPADQERTVAEIVAQATVDNSQQSAPSQSPAPQEPEPQPYPSDQPIDTAQPAQPTPDDQWYPIYETDWPAIEAAYQADVRRRALSELNNSTPPAPPEPAEKQSNLGSTMMGLADGITFGFADEIDAGLGAVLGGPGYETIWSGNSFRDAYDTNVAKNRRLLDDAQEEDPWYFAGGGIAGGLVPVAGAYGGAAKAATALGKLKSASKAGALYGAAYGAGSDTGAPLERLDGAATGAAIGAVGGAGLHVAARAGSAALSPVARKVLPQLDQSIFAKEQAQNPHLLTDAAVSADLDRLVNILKVNRAKSKLSSAQKSTLTSRVDDLEASYLPSEEIKALDLPPSVRARLNAAMARRHLLSDSDVEALRDGTPAGEAVAEGIIKARRLRAHVAETSGTRASAGGAILGEAIGSAAGWKVAGPLGGALGGRIGRAALRSEGRSAKDALALAAKAPKFAQMPEVQASREASSHADSLSHISADAMDESYTATKAATAEAERLEAEGRKVAIANARDNIVPSGGWRGLVYERTGLKPADQDAGALTALKEGAISQEQFDAFLDNPSLLTRGNAGNALMDRLAAYAESGKLTRDPKWTPRRTVSREADLLQELDEIDPIRGALGEGSSFRDSELGLLQDRPADFARANEIRQELSRIRQEGAAGIRNPQAYAATANANQQRVTDAISAVRSNGDLRDSEKEAIASAIAELGNTSDRSRALSIQLGALSNLPSERRAYAKAILSPLVSQIKP